MRRFAAVIAIFLGFMAAPPMALGGTRPSDAEIERYNDVVNKAQQLQGRIECYKDTLPKNSVARWWKLRFADEEKGVGDRQNAVTFLNNAVDLVNKVHTENSERLSDETKPWTDRQLVQFAEQVAKARQEYEAADVAWERFERARDAIYSPPSAVGECTNIVSGQMTKGQVEAIAKAAEAAEKVVAETPLSPDQLRQANDALLDWRALPEEQRDGTFGKINYARFLFVAENIDPDQIKKLEADWSMSISELRRKLASPENVKKNNDAKIAEIIELLFPGKLEDYRADQALLSRMIPFGKGNCEARAKLIVATLAELGLQPEAPAHLYVQMFDDHMQVVSYNPLTRETLDLVTGQRTFSPVVAPLYHPLILAQGALLGRKAKPAIKAEQLARVDAPQSFLAKIARIVLGGVQSNSVSIYPQTGVRFSFSDPPLETKNVSPRNILKAQRAGGVPGASVEYKPNKVTKWLETDEEVTIDGKFDTGSSICALTWKKNDHHHAPWFAVFDDLRTCYKLVFREPRLVQQVLALQSPEERYRFLAKLQIDHFFDHLADYDFAAVQATLANPEKVSSVEFVKALVALSRAAQAQWDLRFYNIALDVAGSKKDQEFLRTDPRYRPGLITPVADTYQKFADKHPNYTIAKLALVNDEESMTEILTNMAWPTNSKFCAAVENASVALEPEIKRQAVGLGLSRQQNKMISGLVFSKNHWRYENMAEPTPLPSTVHASAKIEDPKTVKISTAMWAALSSTAGKGWSQEILDFFRDRCGASKQEEKDDCKNILYRLSLDFDWFEKNPDVKDRRLAQALLIAYDRGLEWGWSPTVLERLKKLVGRPGMPPTAMPSTEK